MSKNHLLIKCICFPKKYIGLKIFNVFLSKVEKKRKTCFTRKMFVFKLVLEINTNKERTKNKSRNYFYNISFFKFSLSVEHVTENSTKEKSVIFVECLKIVFKCTSCVMPLTSHNILFYYLLYYS